MRAVVLVMAVAAMAVADHRSRHIPNALTLGAIALAFVLAVVGESGAVGRVWLGLGGATVVPSLFLGAKRFSLGGGDWKMLAAVGAWLGAVHAGLVEIVVAVIVVLLPKRIERPLGPVVLASVIVVEGAVACLGLT